MTSQPTHHRERGAFLSDLDPGARPIFWAVVASFLWFVVISPLVARGFGSQLHPNVVQQGVAQVGQCREYEASISDVWVCPAEVRWQSGQLEQGPIMARSDVSGTRNLAVVERTLRHGRHSTSVEQLSGNRRVVTTDFPAGNLESVINVTALNFGAVVVIWGLAIAAVYWEAGHFERWRPRRRQQPWHR